MSYGYEHIKGIPIRLEWLGWETDTYRLQRNGWELSAEQDVMRRRMRIALRHSRCGVQGVTSVQDWVYQYPGQSPHEYERGMRHPMSIDIARNIVIQGSEESSFMPIDGYMSYSTVKQMRDLNDMAHFRTIGGPAVKDILLKEASMDEILEFALKKQEPNQEQIRKRMMHEQDMQNMYGGELKASLRLVA